MKHIEAGRLTGSRFNVTSYSFKQIIKYYKHIYYRFQIIAFKIALTYKQKKLNKQKKCVRYTSKKKRFLIHKQATRKVVLGMQ